jgi:phosphinothricin acetyltransferase
MLIRPVCENDAEAIVDIYNYYVTETTVTFEVEPVTKEVMLERIRKAQKSFLWIVAEKNERIIGYSYAGQWRTREAYYKTVESSIYLHKDHRTSGVGKKLYTELLKRLKEDLNIHAVVAALGMPNEASERFHQKMGFERLGLFKETGFKFGQFCDVAYYERLL